MKKRYSVSGMTCGHCAKRVKEAFLKHPEVVSAEVDLDNALVEAEVRKLPDISELNGLVEQQGDYTITGEL